MVKTFDNTEIKIKIEDIDNQKIIKLSHSNSKKEIELTVYNNSDCWECHSHSLDKDGYPKVKLNRKTYRMNRFIYCVFKEIKWKSIYNKLLRHICDNRLCVNPNHLIPGTHEDNMNDMKERDRTFRPIGSLNNMSKLKEEDVEYIRESSMDNEYLSNMFCVGISTIIKIRKGKRWKHLIKK